LHVSTQGKKAAELDDPLDPANTEWSGDGGAGLVFWWLIIMAVAAFAPCMLLPAWREYQAAELAERVGAHQVALAEAELDALERELDAIRNDPVVVSRLARRELELRGPGDDVVAVPVSRTVHRAVAPSPPLSLDPVKPPVAVARLARYLPDLNYDAVFCESPTRETVLFMSAGLFTLSFVLFWPKARGRAAQPGDEEAER
jgi:hypothetical protein